jgi:hypothetical protein
VILNPTDDEFLPFYRFRLLMLHGFQEPVAQLRKRQLALRVIYLPSLPAKVSQFAARESRIPGSE